MGAVGGMSEQTLGESLEAAAPVPAHGETDARLCVAMLGAFPPQAQGVQDYCREIALALARLCEVRALGFKRMYPARVFPGVKQAMDPSKAPMISEHLGVEHRLTWHNPFGWLRAGLFTEADVFHAQWWSWPLWGVTWTIARTMKLRGKPVVLTVHNVLPHEMDKNYLRATRSVCNLADRVLVHSETNRAQLLQYYRLPEEKVVQVPLGPYMAETEKVAKDAACAALDLPPDKRYILTFGTIRPYKGVDDLLQALSMLSPACADVRLIVAGKPWTAWGLYQRVIDANALADRVHLFLDYIPEDRLRYFFGAADLIALPYRHFDAQSGVCAVALPYRKPIIVSEVGGLPDWVDRDPRWTVPPTDPEALARRIEDFFARADDETAAFQAIGDRVLRRFAWDGIAEQHVAVYRELHDRSGKTGRHGHLV